MRLPYSENAKKVLIEAENIASSYSNPSIGTEHILYGLTVNEQCTAGKLLRKYGVNAGYFERYFINKAGITLGRIGFTTSAANSLVNAERLALKFGSKVIGTEQILYCLLVDPSSAAAAILGNLGVDQNELISELEQYIDGEDGTERSPEESTDGKLPPELSDLGLASHNSTRANKLGPTH